MCLGCVRFMPLSTTCAQRCPQRISTPCSEVWSCLLGHSSSLQLPWPQLWAVSFLLDQSLISRFFKYIFYSNQPICCVLFANLVVDSNKSALGVVSICLEIKHLWSCPECNDQNINSCFIYSSLLRLILKSLQLSKYM